MEVEFTEGIASKIVELTLARIDHVDELDNAAELARMRRTHRRLVGIQAVQRTRPERQPFRTRRRTNPDEPLVSRLMRFAGDAGKGREDPDRGLQGAAQGPGDL